MQVNEALKTDLYHVIVHDTLAPKVQFGHRKFIDDKNPETTHQTNNRRMIGLLFEENKRQCVQQVVFDNGIGTSVELATTGDTQESTFYFVCRLIVGPDYAS